MMLQSWENELVPVQDQDAVEVPHWVAALAFQDYEERFRNHQTLGDILRRGGFGQNELIDHLSRRARTLALLVSPDSVPIWKALEYLYEIHYSDASESEHFAALKAVLDAWDKMLG